jgi:hypothetical protein
MKPRLICIRFNRRIVHVPRRITGRELKKELCVERLTVGRLIVGVGNVSREIMDDDNLDMEALTREGFFEEC